jgi:hypothetical protein
MVAWIRHCCRCSSTAQSMLAPSDHPGAQRAKTPLTGAVKPSESRQRQDPPSFGLKIPEHCPVRADVVPEQQALAQAGEPVTSTTSHRNTLAYPASSGKPHAQRVPAIPACIRRGCLSICSSFSTFLPSVHQPPRRSRGRVRGMKKCLSSPAESSAPLRPSPLSGPATGTALRKRTFRPSHGDCLQKTNSKRFTTNCVQNTSRTGVESYEPRNRHKEKTPKMNFET